MSTIAELEQAIKDKRGNLAAVARQFGVSRQAVHKRVKKSARLEDAYHEAKDSMLDNAELELYEQALSGNTSALIFLLKTQGKGRGYTERTEITGADGAPVKIAFVDVVRPDDSDAD
jgi:Zn-dependent peptidase ImmA (M78 family)